MLVLLNVGIPIAMSFGPAETIELYEIFFKTFKTLFDVNLSDFIIESDQGGELKSICRKHNCRHSACRKHLLVNLKTNNFSSQVGALVICETISFQFKNQKEKP